MKFEIHAEIEAGIDSTVKANSRNEAVEKFEEEFGIPHTKITSVNGIEVIGCCEIDGTLVLEGEKTGPYSDVMLCHKCINDGMEP
ncbi:hypothetical protein LCGC14_1710780 [marine sediment metagenome]|uniref:Uncharacterized protein n=1 Tax=marine sediment metagenome TaxID=412755 RepID=A0A0F9HEV2_9ZZZZ